MDTKHICLLGIGILLLLKSVWGIAAPGSAKKAVGWWCRFAGRMNRLLALICIALALAVWGVVLVHQPMTDWLLGLCGVVLACTAVVYLDRDTFQRWANVLVLQRGTWLLRLFSVVGVLVATLMIWAAVKPS